MKSTIKDVSKKPPKVDPEEVARRMGGKVAEPKGRMLLFMRLAQFWIPWLRNRKCTKR